MGHFYVCLSPLSICLMRESKQASIIKDWLAKVSKFAPFVSFFYPFDCLHFTSFAYHNKKTSVKVFFYNIKRTAAYRSLIRSSFIFVLIWEIFWILVLSRPTEINILGCNEVHKKKSTRINEGIKGESTAN